MSTHDNRTSLRAAALALGALCLLPACKGGDQPGADAGLPDGGSSDGGPIVAEALPASFLPFDLKDANATFTASLIVSDRGGGHPKASLSYNGQTFTTGADGAMTIPGVRVRNAAGLRISAEGYLPRSVLLQYASAGRAALRVVLERPGVIASFDAAQGGSVNAGAASITFPGGAIVDAKGQPYAGKVTVAALAVDAVAAALEISMSGVKLRAGFDPAAIPQGYGLAVDDRGAALPMLPESTFQAELSDGAGAPLALAPGKAAGYVIKLSAVTERKAGAVVPVYAFSEQKQRWVAEGSCTVQARMGGGGLDCVGAVKHFSTWGAASTQAPNRLPCGNLKLSFVYSDKYPPSISWQGKTYVTPSALGVRPLSKVLGVEIAPSAASADGTSFLSPVEVGAVRVRYLAYRLDGGKLVADTMRFEIVKGSPQFDFDLPLMGSDGVTDGALDGSQAPADNPFSCPPTYLGIDIAKSTVESTAMDGAGVDPKKPLVEPSRCEGVKCGAGETCIESTGKCWQAPSCSDGMKNGAESDVDCGGGCPACGAGKACLSGADCGSGSCAAGACVAGADMGVPDMGAPGDLAAPADLAVPADLAAPVDRAAPPDLAAPADLAAAPDLAPKCDPGPNMCGAPVICAAIQGRFVAQNPPAQTGGAVADGTYVLTGVTVYTGPGGMAGNLPGTLAQTMVVKTGTFAQSVRFGGGDLARAGAMVFDSNARTATVTPNCGDNTPEVHGYSAGGGQLSLLLADGVFGMNELHVLTKQ